MSSRVLEDSSTSAHGSPSLQQHIKATKPSTGDGGSTAGGEQTILSEKHEDDSLFSYGMHNEDAWSVMSGSTYAHQHKERAQSGTNAEAYHNIGCESVASDLPQDMTTDHDDDTMSLPSILRDTVGYTERYDNQYESKGVPLTKSLATGNHGGGGRDNEEQHLKNNETDDISSHDGSNKKKGCLGICAEQPRFAKIIAIVAVVLFFLCVILVSVSLSVVGRSNKDKPPPGPPTQTSPSLPPSKAPAQQPIVSPVKPPSNAPTRMPVVAPTFSSPIATKPPSNAPTRMPAVPPTFSSPIATKPPSNAPTRMPVVPPTFSSPTTTDPCIDGEETFLSNGAVRDCAWLAVKPASQIFLCREGQKARDICLKLCKNCPGS